MHFVARIVCVLLFAACSRQVIVDGLSCPEPPPNVEPILRRASFHSTDSAGLLVVVRSHYPGNAPGDTLDSVSLSLYRSGYVAGQEIKPGLFWFPQLTTGPYRVDARRVGYAQLVDTVIIREGFRDTLTIGLRPHTICLTLTPLRLPNEELKPPASPSSLVVFINHCAAA